MNDELDNVSEVEEVSTPVENSSEESLGNSTNGEVEVSENVNDAKGSSGKRQYSDLEKAQYSFHKQFSKQKAKYEKMLADQNKSWEERFDRLEHPEKYKKKTREDFSTDDEFIDHLVKQRFDKLMQEQVSEYEAQQAQTREQEEVEASYRNDIQERVKKLFNDEASLNDYHKVVDAALEKGLGKLINAVDPEVSMQIITSEYGPKILYELAKNPSMVQDWFKEGRSSGYRQFMVSKLEDQFKNAKAPQQVKPGIIGKPGIGLTKPKTNIFSSDKALLDFLSA